MLGPDVRAMLRWVSAVALVSPVFMAAPSGDAYRWLDMSVVSSMIAVVAGLLGLLAVSRSRAPAAQAAGALCLLAALVRAVGLPLGVSTPIGGSASTMTFLGALGLGFLLLALADRLPD